MALPRDLAAARGPSGRCEHRPLHWFVVSQGLLFPGWPQHLPLAVGADSISARGGFRRRKVCGTMQASSPTKVYHNPEVAVSRLAVGPLWFVGEGFIPPAGVPAAAGSGGMRASRPTVARVVEAAPVGRASAMVRRGGPWPSRGTLRQCGVPRDDASIVPYRGLL